MKRHGGIWRRIGVVLAAYLLVAQAAIAGAAPHHAAFDMGAQAAWTLCDADQPGGPDAPGQAGDLSCCGVGCLVGAHLLASPDAAERTLHSPAATAVGAISEAQAAWPPTPGVRDRSPRGPPTSA